MTTPTLLPARESDEQLINSVLSDHELQRTFSEVLKVAARGERIPSTAFIKQMAVIVPGLLARIATLEAEQREADAAFEKIAASEPEAYDECCGGGVQTSHDEPPECCAQPIRENAGREIAKQYARARREAREKGGGK